MAKKYIRNNNGVLTETEATTASSGAVNAGDIIALDATGHIDETLLPSGIGADVVSIEASEDLSAGDMVDVYDLSGTPYVRKADATTAGKKAVGFVLDSCTSGSDAAVYFEGQNNQLSGLTAGQTLFLSATTPGGVTATAPSGSGNIVQVVGRAISATSMAFEPAQPIVLA